VLGGVYGLLFALLARGADSAGSGLLRGLAYALALWLLGPATLFPLLTGTHHFCTCEIARAHFPELVGYLLFFGVPLGVTLGLASTRMPPGPGAHSSMARALVGGGVAGTLGGWAFASWMAGANLFPQISTGVDPSPPRVTPATHFLVATLIGASFGVLFQRDARGLGPTLGRGFAYGLFWWFLGPLTLLPLSLGQPVDWSSERAGELYGALIGHLVYGLLVGLIFSAADRLWVGFFYEADPINRRPEGPATRTLRSLGWGTLASLAGGLLFGMFMLAIGALPRLAGLMGGSSLPIAFMGHMAVSVLIGMSYGVLFRDQARDWQSGLSWGLLYGLVWWFLGPLTLLPLFSGGAPTWTAEAADAVLPWLLGHLLYGGTTASVFMLLERRHAGRLTFDSRFAARQTHQIGPEGTSAPALWFFALVLGVLIPTILG
jgi:uncharacterized membrane protein YagU involved in acid resistance